MSKEDEDTLAHFIRITTPVRAEDSEDERAYCGAFCDCSECENERSAEASRRGEE